MFFSRGFKSWCENVAIQQRRELNLRSFDPLNPRMLSKHLGIEVWTAEQVPGIDPECLRILLRKNYDSWSAVTICIESKDLVILNTSHSDSRQASDLMHELSHILLGHEPSRVDVTEDGLLILNTYGKKQEEEANWLCGSLLLPRDALVLIRRKDMDLKIATKKYGVSLDMLEYRLNVTGVNYQFRRARNRSRL